MSYIENFEIFEKLRWTRRVSESSGALRIGPEILCRRDEIDVGHVLNLSNYVLILRFWHFDRISMLKEMKHS